MDLFLDTVSGLLTTDASKNTAALELSGKRGADLDLYIVPDREIPVASTGLFVAAFAAQAEPVISATWTPPADRSKGWLIEVALRGSKFNDIFVGGQSQAVLQAELTVVIEGKVRKSQTIAFKVLAEVHDHSSP